MWGKGVYFKTRTWENSWSHRKCLGIYSLIKAFQGSHSEERYTMYWECISNSLTWILVQGYVLSSVGNEETWNIFVTLYSKWFQMYIKITRRIQRPPEYPLPGFTVFYVLPLRFIIILLPLSLSLCVMCIKYCPLIL